MGTDSVTYMVHCPPSMRGQCFCEREISADGDTWTWRVFVFETKELFEKKGFKTRAGAVKSARRFERRLRDDARSEN